ncbi:MAG TPA: methylglyoxal synthase [bacterium]|nr:methylglyoxal synthase [bacterium]
MSHNKIKQIALVAHDNMKKDLIEWVEFNKGTLKAYEILSTGTTGALIEEKVGIKTTKLKSGPLGGDQQLGAKIANGEIDFLIFFWDPLSVMPHDVDVKSLLRLAVVYNIPVACNRATADFIISSSLMDSKYERRLPHFDEYLSRKIEV